MLKIKLSKKDKYIFSHRENDDLRVTEQRRLKNANQRTILDGWCNALAGDYSLIHSIRPDRGLTKRSIDTSSPFYREPVNKVMSGMDIISTSVINHSKCKHDVDFDDGSGRGCLHVNLELDVPVQNIVGIHTYDVGFPNHTGRFDELPGGHVIDSKALVSKLNEIIKDDDVPYNNLVDFNHFKRHMSRNSWSEVLVVGKSGVNIYSGLPPSQPVKLKAIHYYPVEVYNARVDHGLKRVVDDHIPFLAALMRLNQVKYFDFTLEYKRRKCKAIAYLYDALVAEFGSPLGRSQFYLQGRRR